MSKSSKELVENKTKNLVYCEILFKLNIKEVYLFEFCKEFDKARPTLLKQIQDLEEEGFIGRKIEGRKQLFYIIWNKILKEFYTFLKDRRPDIKIPKKYEVSDPYLIDIFKKFFVKYNERKTYITLEQFYKNIVFSLFVIKPNTKEKKILADFFDNFLQQYFYEDKIFREVMEEIEED